MFFARLAVAALSFGSFAKVFAAPIAVEGMNVAIPETLPTQRRADVNFNTAMANALSTLKDVKGKVAEYANDPVAAAAANPEIVDLLAKVAPAMSSVGDSLKTTGAYDLTQLSTESVATSMAALVTTASDIVESVKGLKTYENVNDEVDAIKATVANLLVILAGVLPAVVALLKNLLVGVTGILGFVIVTLGNTVKIATTIGL
ncbi:hypothetical protein FRC09_002482 [Ceratobasidium sp. 395]|nr:hypothetical protein FRC09_002482 [Ceratobasidium sp. 395]